MSFDLTNKVVVDMVRISNPGRSVSQPTAITPNAAPVDDGQDVRQNEPSNGNNVPIAVPVSETEPVNEAELTEAVSKINDHVQNITRDLIFTVDEQLDRIVITVYDSKSEEVIRQIPSEEVLAIARHLDESIENEGVIMNAEA